MPGSGLRAAPLNDLQGPTGLSAAVAPYLLSNCHPLLVRTALCIAQSGRAYHRTRGNTTYPV